MYRIPFALTPLVAVAMTAAVTTAALAPGMATCAFAKDKAPPAASIPFANHGGIDDWQSDGERTVYFKDNFNHWYKATLMMRATDLPFTVHIGIDPGPGGTLDRFGAVIVGHRRYPFSSFVQVAGPPHGKDMKKHGIDTDKGKPAKH